MFSKKAFILILSLAISIIYFTGIVHSQEYREYTVGLLLDLSGSCSKHGKYTQKILSQAIDEINRNSRVKMSLITIDYGCDLGSAIKAFGELIYQYKVQAVIGPEIPPFAKVVSDYNQNNHRIPQFVLADIGALPQNHSSIFSTMPTKIMRVNFLRDNIESLNIDNILLFGDEREKQFITETSEIFNADYFTFQTPELLNQKLSRIPVFQNSTLLFMDRPYMDKDQFAIFKEKLIRLRNAKVFFIDPRDFFWGLSGSYPERDEIFVVVAKYRYPPYANKQLRDRISSIEINKPTIIDAAAYDAINILHQCFQRGETTNNIVNCLEQADNFLGVSGTYKFSSGNHIGLDQRNFTMAAVRGETGCVNDQNECSVCTNCCAEEEEDCPSRECEKCR
jgi:ABC-type branched-subunit amino acid transport system substrate-binding protein